MSVKQSVIKGLSWSFIDNVSNTAITFIAAIILSRILAPEDFGLVGILAIFIAISNGLINSGFFIALVRKKNTDDLDYNTVFYFNVFMGLITYFVLFFGAPYISLFYEDDRLISITRTLGLILIINSLGIIQNVLFVKNIDYKSLAQITIISSVCSVAIALFFAVKGFGYWSIVAQQLTKQSSNTILLWFKNSWKPRMIFSKKRFVSLYSFGSRMFVAGIIDNVFKNIYSIIIPKYQGISTMGYYTRADQFSTLIINNYASIINRVSLPTLVEAEADYLKFKALFRKIFSYTTMGVFILISFITICSESMVHVLLGEKWIRSIVFIKLLCMQGVFIPLNLINLSLLQIYGKSQAYLNLEIVKKTLFIPVIAVGVFYSIEWMLICGIVSNLISYLLNLFFINKILKINLLEQCKDMLPHAIIFLLLCLLCLPLTSLDLSYFIQLPLLVVIVFIITITYYEVFQIRDYLEIKGIILTILKSRK